MRRLIILLLFLVLSVWFGLTFLRHPGYMLVVYQPWMVQMPLWFALMDKKVLALLSQDQQAKFEKMKGKKVDFELNVFGRRGGRRGGGDN